MDFKFHLIFKFLYHTGESMAVGENIRCPVISHRGEYVSGRKHNMSPSYHIGESTSVAENHHITPGGESMVVGENKVDVFISSEKFI